MKCDNKSCDNDAYTILDLSCDKCKKRLCKECSQNYKCNYCRIPYCSCYGIFCPHQYFHYTISILQNIILYSDDENFIRQFDWLLPIRTFKCTDSKTDKQVVYSGKLTKDIANFIVDQFGKLKQDGDNEELHIDADNLWKWYIQSMNVYTIEEAREIAKNILEIDRDNFWYA